MDESKLVINGALVVAVFFLVAVPLMGVAYGIMEITPGVTQASEIKFEISSFIVSLVFISAPALYAFLGQFLFFNNIDSFTNYKETFITLAASIILGLGCGFSAYALGIANRTLLVSKAKQRKFNVQFYLMNIFIEVVAILSLVMGIIHNMKSGKQ